MTLQELFNISLEQPSFNVIRAADIPELNTLELSDLQGKECTDGLLGKLCNQLIWNYLLKTEALTPSNWGPATLQENVLVVPVGSYDMKYKFHSLPANPINVLSLPQLFPEYTISARNIVNMCKPLAISPENLIYQGIGRDEALWFTYQLRKMEELLWYKMSM